MNRFTRRTAGQCGRFRLAKMNKLVAQMVAAICCLTISNLSAQEASWRPLPSGPIKRIAFGSCAKHWQHQPIWDAIIAKKPDLFLFIGDNIYADTDGRTAWKVTKRQLTGEWNRLADKPEFQRARAGFPFLATWDNHDYGSHAGGGRSVMMTHSRFKRGGTPLFTHAGCRSSVAACRVLVSRSDVSHGLLRKNCVLHAKIGGSPRSI